MIEHITQSLPNSCMSASLAMVLGLKESEIIEAHNFHEQYHGGVMEPRHLLDKHLVPYIRHYADERELLTNRVYIFSVPSLNIEGGSHAIVGVTTDKGEWTLYDPAEGTPCGKYYHHDYVRTDGHKCKGWIPMYSFSTDKLMEWRANITLVGA